VEPAELDEWAQTAASAVGIELGPDDVASVLDLARDAAHGIARPAAPVTAFIAGIAVGRGRRLPEVIDVLNAAIAGGAP
jgi:hypothetical protein